MKLKKTHKLKVLFIVDIKDNPPQTPSQVRITNIRHDPACEAGPTYYLRILHALVLT
jgi:hypothetical protein